MATTTSTGSSTDFGNSVMSNRGHKRYNSADLQLLKQAHSVSCSINQIVERNSLQNDLLSSLHGFITTIEAKLDKIESFFTPTKNDTKKEQLDDDSVASLQTLYDTLINIKNSVFSSSVNLETLSTILDEHYDDLLSSISPSENLGVHEKMLTALHFIDAKINQFNTLVENEARYLLDEDYFNSKSSTFDSIKSFEVKFHNYENAIKKGASGLLTYFELPFPWRENQYIINGYRFHNNHVHAVQSVCGCHNETANIWTHLLGAFFMIYISLVTYPRSELYQRSSFTDNVMIYLYLIASIKCLLSSSFWHTFNGTSRLYLRKKFACIDYTGITVLITAAVVTTEYSALFYYPTTRLAFIAFSLSCGVCGFFFNWSSYFDRPESKPFRVAFYISLSGLGFSAFSILAYHKGFLHALKYYSPIARSSIWYLIGVVFYSSLVPERFRTDVIVEVDQPEEDELGTEKVANNLHLYFKNPAPSKDSKSLASMWWVDYIFASHNIWHVFVLLGALGHYTAIYEMFMNIDYNK